MKHYEVIALSVGGPNNKIYRSRDIVREDNFRPGRAEELVTLGFLRPLPEDKSPESTDDQAPKAEAPQIAPAPGIPALADITPKEIKFRLDLKGVTYNKKANKETLYALLLASVQ